MQIDYNAIENFLDSLADAWNRGDIDLFCDMHTSEARIAEHSENLAGRDCIKKFYLQRHANSSGGTHLEFEFPLSLPALEVEDGKNANVSLERKFSDFETNACLRSSARITLVFGHENGEECVRIAQAVYTQSNPSM